MLDLKGENHIFKDYVADYKMKLITLDDFEEEKYESSLRELAGFLKCRKSWEKHYGKDNSDSTCDLSKDLLEKYDVAILPLHILLGPKEYLDGVNITQREIYEWADANKTTPKTSAPSLDAAVDLF